MNEIVNKFLLVGDKFIAPNYEGYPRGLASMVYKFFDGKSSGSGMINELSTSK